MGEIESIIFIFKIFLIFLWDVFKVWWWIIPPIILFFPVKRLYLWYIQERWYSKIKVIILEIKVPEEVPRLIHSMEQVFAGFHSIHDVLTWKQKWIEGQFQLSISCEIASIDGKIHFYIRTPEMYRSIIESNIYSQYPQAEIFEVEDYTKKVPQNIPNQEWGLFAFDEAYTREDCYPIKTYRDFEEAPGTPEEKRIDPLAGLLEGMATLKEGEQMWLQIVAKPVREEIPWVERGKKIVEKLVKRPTPPPPRSITGEAIKTLITGKPPFQEEKKEAEIIPPEMRLTPGEREIVQGIERKITKFGYYCSIRFVYLGKKDVFFKPKIRIPFGFFKAISRENLGGLKPLKYTFPRVEWIFPKRRVYLRLRRLFRNYLKRVAPFYPRDPAYPHHPGRFVLNTEELATLFHFPGRIAAPTLGLERIGAKKGGPPTIPTG